MRTTLSKYWAYFVIAILLAGAGWIWGSAEGIDDTGNAATIQIAPQEGFLAPDFTLETTKGTQISLSDFRGQAILVNFWASWCPPCRAEMPSMENVYREYQDKGFVVLAINVTHQDNLNDAADFVKEQGFTYPILLDEMGIASQEYQLRSLPTSFFIDREGIIQQVTLGGPIPETNLRVIIEGLIK